ncbi:hypothetical protein Q7W34_00900 [Streptococcus suis]|nr:hypothetical protein [Streptococcus suis]
MITINKDAQVNFKTDSRLLEKAKEVFAMNQLDLTAGFNLFLQNIAVKNELPILTEEELEREELFLQLQKEIQENQQAIEAGQGISLESVKEKYGILVIFSDTCSSRGEGIGSYLRLFLGTVLRRNCQKTNWDDCRSFGEFANFS